jgi:hypothetical protein
MMQRSGPISIIICRQTFRNFDLNLLISCALLDFRFISGNRGNNL